MSDDFLNMPKTFEPFQDSSRFSEGVPKTPEKCPEAVLMSICFANNAFMDFTELTDLAKQ